MQLVRIGELALAALPFEPTVTSGRRMAAALASRLPGVARVVVNGYANGYAGYAVTPEEYDEQGYEGASTLYGRLTVPALCTKLVQLVSTLRTDREARPTEPVESRLAPIRHPIAKAIEEEHRT